MDIISLLKERARLINAEIENVFPRSADKWLKSYFEKPLYKYDENAIQKGIVDPIWEFLDRGGKRWRPALLISACKALEGNTKIALKLAPIVELIHNGTIIVDDVEDNSEMRRGKPAMHLLCGIDCAINNGNLLYFAPLALLFKNADELSDEQKLRIYNMYAEEMLLLSVGQGIDIYWHKSKDALPSEEEYLQMCFCKTGVLARFAARLGAIIANAPKNIEQKLASFGASIGVAFQIQDDILNIAPKSGSWGKELGDDITEGKRTLLVIKACNTLPEEKAAKLLSILNEHTRDKEKIKLAIELIKESGAIQYAKQRARELVIDAWSKLENVLPENEGKKELKALANFLIERDI